MPDNIDLTLSNLIAKEILKILDKKLKESNTKIANLEERIIILEAKQNNRITQISSTNKDNYTILEMPDNRRAPVKMIFTDDNKYDTNTWTSVLVATISYLIGSGKFVFSEKYKSFMSTAKYKPRHAKIRSISGYFVNTNGTANNHRLHINMLLKDHNIIVKAIYNYGEKPKSPKDLLPEKMVLNGKRYDINKWNEIITTTVKHLTNMDIFTLSNKFKRYISIESFDKGRYYDAEVKIDNYYVNLHGAAKDHRKRASIILKEHGIDLSSVKLVYMIDGVEKERELNDVPVVKNSNNLNK